MESLIKVNPDRNLYEQMGIEWVLEKKKRNWMDSERKYRNPTLSFYTSMVYAFAHHLPYSIDIEQPEYVPADFFALEPADVETNEWFHWSDRRSFLNAMVSWGDTYKTGMILEVCLVLQKLILGEIEVPDDFELTDEDYYSRHFDKMLGSEKYNRDFFEVVKSAFLYYKRLKVTTDLLERRKLLEEFYNFMRDKISLRLGIDVKVREYQDVDLIVYNYAIEYWDGCPDVIARIKAKQEKAYNERKQNKGTQLLKKAD